MKLTDRAARVDVAGPGRTDSGAVRCGAVRRRAARLSGDEFVSNFVVVDVASSVDAGMSFRRETTIRRR